MDSKKIYVTDYDKKRLLILIRSNRDRSIEPYIKELEKEVARAEVMSPREIPGNVVTMNSKIIFEFMDTHEEMTCQLVFPEDADFEHGKISILAPIGTALIGYKVGDCIEWNVPTGSTTVRIKKILYQPEAAGDYRL